MEYMYAYCACVCVYLFREREREIETQKLAVVTAGERHQEARRLSFHYFYTVGIFLIKKHSFKKRKRKI